MFREILICESVENVGLQYIGDCQGEGGSEQKQIVHTARRSSQGVHLPSEDKTVTIRQSCDLFNKKYKEPFSKFSRDPLPSSQAQART